jgi:hypothetical protein
VTVTHCLGGFAKRLAATPRTGWQALVEAQPEACPNGCRAQCREVCAQYARMQWRMAPRREAAAEHRRVKR